jgi:histidinol-phosphatase (PHP family)
MSLRIDYHVHTDNSFDCKIPMIEMCAQAVKVGITDIAFTDHFNNHLLDIDLGFYDPDRFFDDIDFCRAKFPELNIVAGIEVGEPHRWSRKVRPVLERYPYDLVMGSLHWVDKENMFNANYYRSRPAQQAYGKYFAEMVKMIEHGGFDVLAHVDLPKRVGHDVYGDFNTHAYEDAIRPVWQACIKHNITPEINTKGLRLPLSQLHPTTEALCWYAEMGGQRLTIGSDSHRPDSIGHGIEEARQSALSAGLTHVCQFRSRKIVGWCPLTD